MIVLIFILAVFVSAAVASTQRERARRGRSLGLRFPLVALPCQFPANSLPDTAVTWIIFVLSMAWVRRLEIPPCYAGIAGRTLRQARLAPSLPGAVLRCRRTQTEETR